MNLSNKDKYTIMKILNDPSYAATQNRLRIFPEKYPVYGDQECYVEIENVESDNNEKRLINETTTTTTTKTRALCRNQSIGQNGFSNGQILSRPNQLTSNNQLLNIFNYTGILYTQTEKKYIQLKLKDFYSNNNSILLTGKIPGNEYEENCFIFIFKSQVCLKPNQTQTTTTPNSSRINYENLNNPQVVNLNRSVSLISSQSPYQQQQQDTNGVSYLIGYTEIKYYKDNYQLLCEYLFHSVYDSSSLEKFELGRYLATNIREEQIEERKLIEHIESQQQLNLKSHHSSISHTDSSLFDSCSFYNFLKSSPFFNYYLNYLRKLNAAKYGASAQVDEFLTRAFKLVRFPFDWTLLGQLCYLDKFKKQPRENLLHLCARYNLVNLCAVLLTLPGAGEAINSANKQGDYPHYLAMKNKFNNVSNLMCDFLNNASSSLTNPNEQRINRGNKRNHNQYSSSNALNSTTDNNTSCHNEHLMEQIYTEIPIANVNTSTTSNHSSSSSRSRKSATLEGGLKAAVDLASRRAVRYNTGHQQQHHHLSSAALMMPLQHPHHHRHLSISDIKCFSSNLLADDGECESGKDYLVPKQPTAGTTVCHDRPISSDDIIIIDDDDQEMTRANNQRVASCLSMKNINTSADQQQPTTQVKSGPKSSRHIMRRQSTSINEYQQLDDDFYDNNNNNRNEYEEGGDEDDEDEEDGDSALFNRGRRRRMMIKASVSSTSLLNAKIGHKNANFAATVTSANQKFRVKSLEECAETALASSSSKSSAPIRILSKTNPINNSIHQSHQQTSSLTIPVKSSSTSTKQTSTSRQQTTSSSSVSLSSPEHNSNNTTTTTATNTSTTNPSQYQKHADLISRRKKSARKSLLQRCQPAPSTNTDLHHNIYCQTASKQLDDEEDDDDVMSQQQPAQNYYESIDTSTSSASSQQQKEGDAEREYENINEMRVPSDEEIDDDCCHDEDEDEEVAIEDYSCFDAATAAQYKNVLNSTKKFDESKSELNFNEDDSKLIAAAKQHSHNQSKSVENKKLPPLPRTPHSALPLQIAGSGSDCTVPPPIDFDRSLNIRRSKRFVRQAPVAPPQSSQLTTHEIHLASPQPTQLQKAISTPSILDKLKLAASNNTPPPLSAPPDASVQVDSFLDDDRANIAQSVVSLNTAASSATDQKKSESKYFKYYKRSDSCITTSRNTLSEAQIYASYKKNYELIEYLVSQYDLQKTGSESNDNNQNVHQLSFLNDLASSVPNSVGVAPVSASNSNASCKDLMTINEFLKEFEMPQLRSDKSVDESSPGEDHRSTSVKCSSSSSDRHSHQQQSISFRLNSTGDTSSINLMPNAGSLSLFTPPATSLLSMTSKTPTDMPRQSTSMSYHSSASSSSSTPLRCGGNGVTLPASTSSSCEQPNKQQSSATMSKSKKLGQILKLASVRGAKSKSMKHKYSNCAASHSFVALTAADADCHVCQKSMHNKKALQCKNCLMNVHDSSLCKDQIGTCMNLKSATTKYSLSTNILNTNLTSKQLEKLKQLANHSTSNTLDINHLSTTSSASSSSTSSRPRSMDITKLFQAHLSKSTSNMYSKSINEESPDYDAIKALRESVDSLVYKFDENSTAAAAANFRLSLNDLNKEFSHLDNEFSANNWADMQTEEFLKTLNKNIRNRQENIFEFVKTELNYVKILTITQKVYVNVMLNDCRVEPKYLLSMFPDLDRFADLHKSLLEQLINRYKVSKNKFIDSIGDILLKIFDEKSDDMIEIYSKVCCMHLTAKSTYKQLSTSNKSFAAFLIECQKNKMLKRYQIPDCLTIITQRLTKYLTLIENMINNSKDDKTDSNLLSQSLDKLKFILNRVNDAVAFYQNSNEFKKLYENIDAKSFTYSLVKIDKQIEHRKITKADLLNKPERRILAMNSVIVKCMSKNGKVYKDVTCLTMNDMIVFLQLNDKTKYVFMNENSVIPCTNGILIRPKANEINPSRSTSFSSTHNNNSNTLNNHVNNSTTNSNSNSQTTTSLTTSSQQLQQQQQQNGASNVNISSSSSQTQSTNFTLPSYIVNTITNEIIEIKFPDEISRNQWLNLVHTHITPFLEENLTKEESSSHLESMIHPHHQSLSASNSFSGSSSSQKSAAASKSCSLKSTQQQQQQQQQQKGAHRCNSNCSSSSSSGQGSSICSNSSSKMVAATIESSILPITDTTNIVSSSMSPSCDLTDAGGLLLSSTTNNSSSSSASSPNGAGAVAAAKMGAVALLDDQTGSLLPPDMQLSPDLANLLYSFNNIIESSSLFHGNLMRSASSAGETITKNVHESQVSIPKRAETFNGASSTSKEEINICCSDIIMKSRMMYMKTSNSKEDNNQQHHSCSSNNEDTKSEHHHPHHHHHNHRHRLSLDTTSTSTAAADMDSAYQSRLCVVDDSSTADSPTTDSCSCVFVGSDSTKDTQCSSCSSSGVHHKSSSSSSSSSSVSRKSSGISRVLGTSAPIEEERSTSSSASNLAAVSSSSSTQPTTMPRAHFESIIKLIINDYMRLKSDNEGLKRELNSKDKTIDLLKKAIDECKNQLDSEKQKLQKKYSEVEKTEQGASTIDSRHTYSDSNKTGDNTANNKLSILVKCERSLLSNNNNNTAKKEDNETQTQNSAVDSTTSKNTSSILFL